ncbi:serine/threonine protein kinase Pkn6 [Archangium gephyra]|uniref:Serine/threonine protein kinase Pkn6 n=2 Tax=Archangium gephyra TaxID=48 RepID=A0AAC8Q2C5_9BACT|nr:serine/threonine-protein kinase [Archangium gephyra]AKI99620.1 serine/threonine protein kinase Pkn6 [Archangium gephyra]
MQQVGKYQLVRKLATGGMAEVFLAKAAGPMGFEKTLVLKRILPHLAEETAFVEMFLSEAKLAAQLTHPNIVQIFDFGESEGTYFLAMEYIDGPSLRTLIKRALANGMELPLAVCARLVAQACEGLAFAHDFADPETGEAQGLIHRDISPDNILLSKQGAVKVVDFGIAKAAGQAHKTASGVIKGKIAYMPPEQVRAESLDRRVDVYALGVVLYELLTGHKPFEAESDVGVMRAILYQSPMPAVQFRPELPDSMRRVLGRALAKDREQRYPDCHAFQSDLEEFILSVGKPVTTQQVAQLITQVASSTEPASASQPGTARGEPTHSATPVHTPPPRAHEEKTDVEAAEAPQTVRLRKPQTVKEEVTDVEAPKTVPLRQPQAVKEEVTDVEAPKTVPLRQPQAVKEEVTDVEAPKTVPLRQPQAEKDVVAVEATKTVQVRQPQAVKEEGAVAEAPKTVQLRQSPPVKEESPEDHSERPTAPDIRPLPSVRRPSMEVLSAQRKSVEPQRGGKWRVALVASVLIAGGAGVLMHRTGSFAPAPQESAPLAKQTSALATPPSTGPVAEKAPAAEPPPATSSAPSTDSPGSGEGPQENLEVASAAGPQDAGVTQEDSPSEPGTPPPQSAPLQAGEQKPKVKPTRAAKSIAKGKVEFRVRPYATVFLSGKELGDTPMDPVELPPGNYTVKLVNKSMTKTLSIRVVNGETTVIRHNFTTPE